MPIHTKKINYYSIILSFVIAIFLTILPLPHWMIWARPQWIFALLLFWVITMPFACGVGLAWIVGIMTDIVTGTALCSHALTFVLLVYFILKMHRYITHSFMWQQIGIIALFSSFNVMLRSVILGFSGNHTHLGLSMLSVITTALIWPVMFTILNHKRQ